MYVLLYVGDMLIAGTEVDVAEIRNVKEQLKADFEMKDLANRILGMDIIRDREEFKLWLFQTDYINIIIKKFNVKTMKTTETPLAQHLKLSSDQGAKVR